MLLKLACEGAILTINGGSAEECLEELVSPLHEKGRIASINEAVTALLAREQLKSTVLDPHIAVPHARIPVYGSDVALSIGIHKQGVNFNAPDGKPVRLFFVIISSPAAQNSHLAALARIARLVKTTDFMNRTLSESEDPFTILKEEENKLP